MIPDFSVLEISRLEDFSTLKFLSSIFISDQGLDHSVLLYKDYYWLIMDFNHDFELKLFST